MLDLESQLALCWWGWRAKSPSHAAFSERRLKTLVSIALSGAAEINFTVCVFHKADTSDSSWVEAEGGVLSLDLSEVNAILTDHKPSWPESVLPRNVTIAESCSKAFPCAFLPSSSPLVMLKKSELSNQIMPWIEMLRCHALTEKSKGPRLLK